MNYPKPIWDVPRDTPTYSITGSKERWFWTAWEQVSSVFDGAEPTAYGHAPSKESGVQAAADALGVDLSECYCYISKTAATWRKVYTQRNRKSSAGADTAAVEFIYQIKWCDYDGCDHPWRSVETHRIIKRTPQFIFVATEPLTEGRSDTWTRGTEIIDTFRLDRIALESGEGVSNPRSYWAGKFYLDQNAEPERVPSSSWRLKPHLEILELTWPSTLDELKTAYRLKSRETHPDSGGNSERFIAVKKAYEELKPLAVVGGAA